MQLLITSNYINVILIGCAFVIALFVGLLTIVLAVVFLPGLMRTTGETIGSSDPKKNAAVVANSVRVASRPRHNRTLTTANRPDAHAD
jgi:hypothetical protein